MYKRLMPLVTPLSFWPQGALLPNLSYSHTVDHHHDHDDDGGGDHHDHDDDGGGDRAHDDDFFSIHHALVQGAALMTVL